MKKLLFVFMVIVSASLYAGGNEEKAPSAPAAAAGPTLDDVIKQAAAELGAALPVGRSVIITKFDSEAQILSNYIIDSLTGYLVRGGKVKVVTDRLNMAYIRKELERQESGEVSEESAQRMGRQAGAQTMILGSLVKLGNAYRFQVTAVGIESAINEASTEPRDVGGYDALLASLKSGEVKAETEYRELLANQQPETSTDYVNRAIIFMERQNYDIALLDLNDAIKLDPKNAVAYYQRGNLYFWDFIGGRDYDHAIVDYTEAIKINPNYADAYDGRSRVYAGKKDLDKALADLTQTIRLEPNNASRYNIRAWAYLYTKNYYRAIADAEQAIKLDPNNVLAYEVLAYAHEIQDNYYAAISEYTHAIEIQPDNGHWYEARAELYEKIGDKARAEVDRANVEVLGFEEIIPWPIHMSTTYERY